MNWCTTSQQLASYRYNRNRKYVTEINRLIGYDTICQYLMCDHKTYELTKTRNECFYENSYTCYNRHLFGCINEQQ